MEETGNGDQRQPPSLGSPVPPNLLGSNSGDWMDLIDSSYAAILEETGNSDQRQPPSLGSPVPPHLPGSNSVDLIDSSYAAILKETENGDQRHPPSLGSPVPPHLPGSHSGDLIDSSYAAILEETGNGDQRQPPSFGSSVPPHLPGSNLVDLIDSYNAAIFKENENGDQRQPPSFGPPTEAHLPVSRSGLVESGDGQHQQPSFVPLANARRFFSSPYTAITEPIDWAQFPASPPFAPPATENLPVHNSAGSGFWMGFNSSYPTAMEEPRDARQRQPLDVLDLSSRLPAASTTRRFRHSNPSFGPLAYTHLPDSRSGLVEPGDGQHQQPSFGPLANARRFFFSPCTAINNHLASPPFEPPATENLPVQNSAGSSFWMGFNSYPTAMEEPRDAQQRQPLDVLDLSSRLPAAFATRRIRFNNNNRSRPVGGKKRERTAEEKEAHRMACRRSRQKIKAQNDHMRVRMMMMRKQIEMLRNYELVNNNKYNKEEEAAPARMTPLPAKSDIHHIAELFTSQNHQADTVNTDITASGPGTENLVVGNKNNEQVDRINRISATVRRRELGLQRLRNVATKHQQLARFPGEMQKMLGTVGGSISRLAEEGETMNVDDLERQTQELEDSFRQWLQEMRNKYFDHDKDSSHTSMFSFEHFQDFIGRLDFLEKSKAEFEGSEEESERSWRFNLPVPSFLPTHEKRLKYYGDIADQEGYQSTLLITESYTLLCSVIKEMNQLQLEQLNLSIMILWGDAINSDLDWSFDEHLKKIAYAYFWFFFKRKE